ncbi:MAG: flagellar hook-length control protein FliK [Bdellovibrionales bacterium]|nr:flagellar hook-length control protein FliK [Bdellovibrionales bacterium]
MTTPIPPNVLAALQQTAAPNTSTVKIPSTQILPQLLPTLNLGDILRFNVRSNPPSGPGVLYYQGQLIKTQLPPTVQTGDKLIARLEKTGEQVVFKILEQLRADGTPYQPGSTASTDAVSTSSGASSAAASPFEQIVDQVEQLIRRTSVAGTELLSRTTDMGQPATASAKPIPIPTQLPEALQLREQVATLLRTIGANDSLGESATVAKQLQSVAQGTVSQVLRETADAIRTALKHTPSALPPTERFLVLLRHELSALLPHARDGIVREDIMRPIDNLLRAVDTELKHQKRPSGTREGDLLKLALTDLKLAREHPEQVVQHLESALSRLHEPSLPSSERVGQLDPKAVAELQQLAGRLESLAASHETLNQLNPLMQALGEPALLLFPFVLQGLLRQSEIAVDPDDRRKQSSKTTQTADDTPSQRIQISVPLPTLGTIEVDMQHRGHEVTAQFRVEDEQVASFLAEQLTGLQLALRQQSLRLIEFHTEVGLRGNSIVSELRPSDSLAVC